ncbi:hypothetical protein PIB30_009222 [Stylosanthes scabra]|uniref:Uncharacterized protein n=1 Tax=Stylosanthes scabra TaxID=79078 RepID=A0ABU6Q511_9FABA|nr:hypothetical protein [Stylosanthes scabra]
MVSILLCKYKHHSIFHCVITISPQTLSEVEESPGMDDEGELNPVNVVVLESEETINDVLNVECEDVHAIMGGGEHDDVGDGIVGSIGKKQLSRDVQTQEYEGGGQNVGLDKGGADDWVTVDDIQGGG